MVELEQLVNGIGLGVWEAIAQFQALASSSLGLRRMDVQS
jgi:hypothetical protein